MTKDVERALWVAYTAHTGQFRKFLDDPYILHPLRVRDEVEKLSVAEPKIGLTDDAQVAALLHDVVEDTKVTLADLAERFHFSQRAVALVELLTKPVGFLPDRDKPEYYRRIAHDPVASLLKVLDRLDNLHDMQYVLLQQPSGAAVAWILAYTAKTAQEFTWAKRAVPGLYTDLARAVSRIESDLAAWPGVEVEAWPGSLDEG